MKTDEYDVRKLALDGKFLYIKNTKSMYHIVAYDEMNQHLFVIETNREFEIESIDEYTLLEGYTVDMIKTLKLDNSFVCTSISGICYDEDHNYYSFRLDKDGMDIEEKIEKYDISDIIPDTKIKKFSNLKDNKILCIGHYENADSVILFDMKDRKIIHEIHMYSDVREYVLEDFTINHDRDVVVVGYTKENDGNKCFITKIDFSFLDL